jgi:ElaB/YqjD/DUF883 family membrane-anchored ribosome-binding protein
MELEMAGSNNNPSTEDLVREIETLRADLARVTETLAEMGKAEARSMADEVRKRSRKARAHVEDEFEHLRGSAEAAIDQADELIRERPAIAMTIAAGLGLIVGLLLYRKD